MQIIIIIIIITIFLSSLKFQTAKIACASGNCVSLILVFVFASQDSSRTHRRTQKHKMTKLTELIGIIKDKASQSKAALLSQRTTLSLLRATSHDSFTPPTQKHLHTLLSSGDGSRATASAAVEILMDRLQSTNNSAVALKCLIAVHHIIKHGTFILQDQLSVYPSAGGRNYLNLSNFRHATDPISWELSSWVRWFAQHIENLLCTARILGFFIGNSPHDREERASGLTNGDLLTEFDSLVTVVEGICKKPDRASTKGNRLVEEIVRLVREDWVEVVAEVRVGVVEFRERLGGFKFGEAVELVCCLKRLDDCRERVVEVCCLKRLDDCRERVVEVGDEGDERLWEMVREVKNRVGMEVYKEESKVHKEVRKLRMSESDRFPGRVLSSDDRFPSGRLL